MKTIHFNNHEYNVVAGQYPADHLELYVCLIDVNDHMNMSAAHRLTVCLPDSHNIEEAGMAYINTNLPNFDVVRMLSETELAKPVIKDNKFVTQKPGFVEYSLYQFDMTKILQLADPDNLRDYIQFWNSYYEVASMEEHIIVIPDPAV